ncbi:MAG: hypothetical protein ABL984_15115 [Pyrinomonadaceae bacterium]
MTKSSIQEIWLEAEQWADGEWNLNDDNSDVIVIFENGEKWIASFFTYQNIQTLVEKFRESGECLSGAYFRASDMILIDELSRSRIESVINDLIREGEFETAFDKIEVEQ